MRLLAGIVKPLVPAKWGPMVSRSLPCVPAEFGLTKCRQPSGHHAVIYRRTRYSPTVSQPTAAKGLRLLSGRDASEPAPGGILARRDSILGDVNAPEVVSCVLGMAPVPARHAGTCRISHPLYLLDPHGCTAHRLRWSFP